MVEVVCLKCEKAIEPQQLNDPVNYDTESYDGQIRCQECKALLYVKLVKGRVQKCKQAEEKPPHTVYDTEVVHRPDGRTETRKVVE